MQWEIPDADKSTQQASLNDAFINLLNKHRDIRLQELLNKSQATELNAEEKNELSELYSQQAGITGDSNSLN